MTLKDEIDQYKLWNKFVLEGGPLPPMTSPFALGHLLTFIDDLIAFVGNLDGEPLSAPAANIRDQLIKNLYKEVDF